MKTVWDYHLDFASKVECKYQLNVRNYQDYKFRDVLRQQGCSNAAQYNRVHLEQWERVHYPIILEWESQPTEGCRFNEAGRAFAASHKGCAFWTELREAYAADPDGFAKEIPYMDFWHLLVDFTDMHNGLVKQFSWRDVFDFAVEDWQREVAQLFIDEFGEDEYDIEFTW